MSESIEAAKADLEKAGFELKVTLHNGPIYMKGERVAQITSRASLPPLLTYYGTLSDLLALLNPITPEKVAEAVRYVLGRGYEVRVRKDRDNCRAMDEQLITAILARLKENA